MPTRSATCGTPTRIPTPSPVQPHFSSPNNSYSSVESNDNLELPPCVPLKELIATPPSSSIIKTIRPEPTITSTSLINTSGEDYDDGYEGEEEEEEVNSNGRGITMVRSLTPPDWRLSILAQKKYSAAIHLYTEKQWEATRVEIERESSISKKR